MNRRRRLRLAIAFVAWSGACAAATPAWTFDGSRLVRHGITLAAIPSPVGARHDISILSPRAGLDKLAGSLDILINKSALAANALATLKRSGRVFIVYDAAFPEKTVGSFAVAAFLPTYFKRQRSYGKQGGGKKGDFVAVIGRYGIKWPARELAGVIGHELIGHGLQFLQRRRDSMRELDRECEARLYQERVNQDVRLDKMSRITIEFRKTMEDKYCAGFKRFMRRKSPALNALWDEINPDVPQLLKLFQEYLVEMLPKDR
ncbi:MAG: hypothetical protein HQ514_20500 [Rhodospirillales bacterium]|nr:hypothetical protein [Rhodospirillales bacterium]